MSTLAFFSMGLSEMVVIAVVALLVFGGRLPEVMHTLGKTYAKFRRGMSEISNPLRQEMRRIDASVQARTRTSEELPPAADEPPPYQAPKHDADDEPRPLGTEPYVPTRGSEDRPTPSGGGAGDEPPPV